MLTNESKPIRRRKAQVRHHEGAPAARRGIKNRAVEYGIQDGGIASVTITTHFAMRPVTIPGAAIKRSKKMDCQGLKHLELRKKKIELIRQYLAPSNERNEIEGRVNAGDVESVSYTKGEYSFLLIVRYYSGGESIFNV